MKYFLLFLIPVFFIVNGCNNSGNIEIIIAENAGDAEKNAANELQHYLSKMYPDQIFSIAESVTSNEFILLSKVNELKNEPFNTFKANNRLA